MMWDDRNAASCLREGGLQWALDQRPDLYTLGLVLYEMLADAAMWVGARR